MDEAIRNHLTPGSKVKVTQQIPARNYVWTNEIRGTILEYQQDIPVGFSTTTTSASATGTWDTTRETSSKAWRAASLSPAIKAIRGMGAGTV